jgi:hypothetical protein
MIAAFGQQIAHILSSDYDLGIIYQLINANPN